LVGDRKHDGLGFVPGTRHLRNPSRYAGRSATPRHHRQRRWADLNFGGEVVDDSGQVAANPPLPSRRCSRSPAAMDQPPEADRCPIADVHREATTTHSGAARCCSVRNWPVAYRQLRPCRRPAATALRHRPLKNAVLAAEPPCEAQPPPSPARRGGSSSPSIAAHQLLFERGGSGDPGDRTTIRRY